VDYHRQAADAWSEYLRVIDQTKDAAITRGISAESWEATKRPKHHHDRA
jgi:hypothetical protein